MGVYSINESVLPTNVDWEAVEEFAGEPNFDGACELVAESEINYNRFMQAVGISELNYLETNGQEMVYEGGRLSGYIEKAKKFFHNILEKIKGFIKKFMVKVDSLVRSNDGFLKKYGSEISKLNEKVKINGYKFSNLGELNFPEAKTVVTTANGTAEDRDIKTKVLGSNVGEDFSEAIFKHFHGEETSKKEVELSPSEQIQIIKNTKDLRTKAKKTYTEADKKIKDIIKRLDNQAKNINKKDVSEDTNAEMQKINSEIKGFKTFASAMQLVQGGYLSALRAQNSQAKAVCVKALQGKYKEDTKKNLKEGFSHYEDDFLSEVEFV